VVNVIGVILPGWKSARLEIPEKPEDSVSSPGGVVRLAEQRLWSASSHSCVRPTGHEEEADEREIVRTGQHGREPNVGVIHVSNGISRRRFFHIASAGAVAAGAACWPGLTWAAYFNLTYKLHGDGWDDYNRRKIAAAAMDLVGNMSQDSVLQRSYQLSGTSYHLTGGTWDRTNPNSHYRGLGYKDVLWAQVSNLGNTTTRPVVNIHPYYANDFSWGKANYDLVSVKFSPGRFVVEGEFDIYLNFSRLGGGGDHSSPAAWAGLICHEMLHNLGHMHGEGDYRTSLQINALQQAVFEAGKGSEHIVAARHFRCGGRVG
jgi:hypothetical protein